MTRKTSGASTPTMESYTALLAGTQTLTTAAAVVNIGTRVTSYTCIIQASNNNTQGSIVYIGNQYGQYFELVPGASVAIPVDANEVYARGSVTGLVINWLAGG